MFAARAARPIGRYALLPALQRPLACYYIFVIAGQSPVTAEPAGTRGFFHGGRPSAARFGCERRMVRG